MAAITEKIKGRVLDARAGLDQFGSTQYLPLGARVETEEGATYVYCKASATITGQGYFCVVDAAHAATMITKTLADQGHPENGPWTGNGAAAANDYGWVCVRAQPGSGPGVQVAASTSVDAGCYSSGTAGQLDTVATSQTLIVGVHLNTAQGSAAGVNTTAVINTARAEVA